MNERDVSLANQTVSTEPPKRGATIRTLRKIASSFTPQWKAILGAYVKTPQISGETLTNAAPYTGDIGETEEVNIKLPPGFEKSILIERGDELVLVRPEIEEAVQVEPKPTASAVITGGESIPQALSSSVNRYDPSENTFLKEPAEFKKAA